MTSDWSSRTRAADTARRSPLSHQDSAPKKGKTTGMPPRIAFLPSKTAMLDVHAPRGRPESGSASPSRRGRSSASAPEPCSRMTLGWPLVPVASARRALGAVSRHGCEAVEFGGHGCLFLLRFAGCKNWRCRTPQTNAIPAVGQPARRCDFFQLAQCSVSRHLNFQRTVLRRMGSGTTHGRVLMTGLERRRRIPAG